MTMLNSVKMALRISHDELNDEIVDLIEAARADLALSGVLADKRRMTMIRLLNGRSLRIVKLILV